MAADTEQKRIELILKAQQADATLRELRSASRLLNAELGKLPINSKEFAEKSKDLQQINKRLRAINEDVRGVGGVFNKIGKEIKAFGVVALGALGFQWLSGKVSNLISQNAKLSDSFADIRKTTGMTEAEVKKLNKAFSQMNTRTATADLREIAISAGQLGIAKGDILAFTAATDKLVVALGDEFTGGAEQVTKEMGALRNIFSDIKSDKIDDDMLRIGNAINELGASGMATGPVVADFANRIGGVGISLGLTSGQVLGLSATLQELNVSTERGGTAITKILLKMTQKTEEFAEVAGMSTKEFTELVNKDLYGAFVKVAEGATKSGSSATQFSQILDGLGVDGAGASEVFAKLGSNTELLQQKVDLANVSLQGTDSIMNEFNIKNQTFGANIDKIGKALSNAFVNSAIMNGMNSLVGWIAEMTQNTHAASEAMAEEQLQVNSLLIELKSANTTQERRYEIYELLKAISPDIINGIDKENISIIALTKNVEEYNKQQINRIVIQKHQEKLDVAQQNAAEKQIEMQKQQAIAYEKLTRLKNVGGEIGVKARKINDDETLSISEKVEMLQKLSQEESWVASGGSSKRVKGAKELESILSYLGKVTSSEKEYNQALEESNDILSEKNQLMADLGMDKDSSASVNPPEPIAPTPIIDPEISDKIKKQREKLNEEIAKLDEEAYQRGLSDDIRELERVDYKYTKLLEEAKGFSEQEEALKLLWAQERIDKEAELQTAADEKAKKRQEELAKEKAKIEDEIYLASLSENDREIVAVMQKYDAFYEAAAKYGIDISELKKQEEAELDAIRERQKKKEIKSIEEILELKKKAQMDFLNAGVGLLNNYMSMLRATNRKEISANDQKLQQQLKANDDKLKADLISQEKHDKIAAELQAANDARNAALQNEMFEKQQATARAIALINGAEAITKIWAKYASVPPIAIGLSVIAGAATALQLKTINQQVPAYAKGGYHTSDTAEGFTSGPTLYTSSSTGAPFIAGEAGKEWIGPNWMLEHPKTAPIFDMLESFRQNRSFASGGSTALDNRNSVAPSIGNNYNAAGFDSNRLTLAIERLNAHLDRGIEAYMDYNIYKKDLDRIDNAKNSSRIG